MKIIDTLLASEKPSLRYKIISGVVGEAAASETLRAVQEEIRSCPRVTSLLANRREDGRIEPVNNPYDKWRGAHWVLATLADMGYPPGDESLQPALDQVLDCWLKEPYFNDTPCTTKAKSYGTNGVPVLEGRHRRCASQQGNALFVALKLGLADERAHALVERLLHWQWPDGGWNCDRKPKAETSSFMETLIPLRALALYAKETGEKPAAQAAERAAEVFLERRLFKGRRDGKLIHPTFVKLHYPCYWHYDILFALKVMAEAGFIGDERCCDALDLLESKRLDDGGWPAEASYYTRRTGAKSEVELVSWGGTSKRRSNEWVTADALVVLAAAGRLKR